MSDVLQLPACTVHLDRRRAVFPDREEKLTARDVEVLRYLAARAGQTVTREALEQDVWKMAASVRSEAVPVAMRRIRARIERDPGNPEALLTDYGNGWSLQVAEAAPTPSGPAPLGREAVLGAIEAGWSETRLQTLVGPGGVGKTTLAKAASPVGALFVDLTGAQDAMDCREALRQALPGLSLTADEEGWRARIQERLARVPLVVVDNAEQVLDGVRALIEGWTVRVLVTSRARLELPTERVVRVEPLEHAAAAELFERRYRDAGGTSALDPEAVGELVDRLDRLPLAIELVAPRARLLSPEALLQGLERGIDAVGRARGRTERHQTIRACLAWSLERLGPSVVEALRAAAMFAAPVGLEDVEAVLERDAFEDLAQLVEHSLLREVAPGRFSMLVLVRAHAREQALPPGWIERYTARILQRYDELGGERAAGPGLAALARDLHQVVLHSPEPQSVKRAALAARAALQEQGHPAAGLRSVEKAIERVGTDVALELARIKALLILDPAAAHAVTRTVVPEDDAQRLTLLSERYYLAQSGHGEAPSLAEWEAVIDGSRAFERSTWALALFHEDRLEEAKLAATQAVAQARQEGAPRVLMRALYVQDFLLTIGGDQTGTEARLGEALRIARELDYREGIAAVLNNLAMVISRLDRQAADEAFDEAARVSEQVGRPDQVAMARCNQAVNAWLMGEVERGVAIFDALDPADTHPARRVYEDALRTVLLYQVGRASEAAVRAALEPLVSSRVPFEQVPGALLGAVVLGDRFDPALLERLEGPPYQGDLQGLLDLWAASAGATPGS